VPIDHTKKNTLDDSYKLAVATIEKWNQEIKQGERLAEQAAKNEAVALQRQRLCGVLCAKYALAIDSEPNEILNTILDKNKYLRLAYYLEKNRSDWNDGPYYAECGLEKFPVVSDIDREISKEISGHISDWDGDGRVFRDCKWNYSALYEMVGRDSPELYSDFIELTNVLPSEC
jgi:hypothetical protein